MMTADNHHHHHHHLRNTSILIIFGLACVTALYLHILEEVQPMNYDHHGTNSAFHYDSFSSNQAVQSGDDDNDDDDDDDDDAIRIDINNTNSTTTNNTTTSTTTPTTDQDAQDHDNFILQLLQDQQNCSTIQNPQQKSDSISLPLNQYNQTHNTISCPCGSLTTSKTYIQNMIKQYRHIQNKTLLKTCLSLNLPLTSSYTFHADDDPSTTTSTTTTTKTVTPQECWPKIFMQASYPTSGCELSRLILSSYTSKNQLLSQYEEGAASPFYTLDMNERKKMNIFSTCKQETEKITSSTDDDKDDGFDGTNLPIPLMGQAMIWKTHGPKRWGIWLRRGRNQIPSSDLSYRSNVLQDENIPSSYVHGIIHLTRNPGDQLLRDSMRWKTYTYKCDGAVGAEDDHNDYLHDKSCQGRMKNEFCPKAMDKVKSWNDWHTYWIQTSPHANKIRGNSTQSIPRFTFAYEHFSNLEYANIATSKIIKFINDDVPVVDNDDEQEEEEEENSTYGIEKLIKEPSYVHGTLFAKYCGRELALKLHKLTKDVSEQLGYMFDEENATWSLPLIR